MTLESGEAAAAIKCCVTTVPPPTILDGLIADGGKAGRRPTSVSWLTATGRSRRGGRPSSNTAAGGAHG
jgi:hypothetical protein